MLLRASASSKRASKVVPSPDITFDEVERVDNSIALQVALQEKLLEHE